MTDYLNKKESERAIKRLKKLLWKLPNEDRLFIVKFMLKKSKSHNIYYVSDISNQIFDVLTGSKRFLDPVTNKITHRSGVKSLHTPFFGFEKSEKKTKKLFNMISRGISMFVVENDDKQEKIAKNIIDGSFYCKIKNILTPKIDKLSDYLFEQGLSIVSPNYRMSVKSEKILTDIQKNSKRNISQKEIDLVLGEFTSRLITQPRKIVTTQIPKKNFYQFKNINIYTHE